MFLPSVPTLMEHAAEMENERDHVLDRPVREDGLDDELLAEANRQRDTTDVGEELPFETVEASATFDRVLYDGGEFGMHAQPGSPEEEEYLGIPGLLTPEEVSALLRKRQAEQIAEQRKGRRKTGDPRADRTAAEDLAALRRELNGLVGAWNHRTGKPHGVIHTELRAACGGPAIAQATAEDVKKRIAKIREWAAKRRH